jgi:hypothetical protein
MFWFKLQAVNQHNGFTVGWVKPVLRICEGRSEPTIYKYSKGGFGVKTNALIHPTHNLNSKKRITQFYTSLGLKGRQNIAGGKTP